MWVEGSGVGAEAQSPSRSVCVLAVEMGLLAFAMALGSFFKLGRWALPPRSRCQLALDGLRDVCSRHRLIGAVWVVVGFF